MVTRQQIVTEARKWIGTQFRHQGRRRGQGVDCVGLALCIGEDLGLHDVAGSPLLRTDYQRYGSQPTTSIVHDECCARLVRKELKNATIQPGDVLTLRVPILACHVAIVTNLAKGELGIVHAYAGSKKVVEHTLSEKWLHRIEGFFTFPGID